MAGISIPSKTFLSLVERVEPILQAQANAGMPRAIVLGMRPYFPGKVLEALNRVRAVAERGIRLAGDEAHVVFDEQELPMLEWALEQKR